MNERINPTEQATEPTDAANTAMRQSGEYTDDKMAEAPMAAMSMEPEI